MRKTVLLAVALATAVSLASFGAQADHNGHCRDIFVLSGTDAVRDPVANSRLAGANAGAVACTLPHRTGVPYPNTNFLTPGATVAWVGVGLTAAPTAPSGTAKIGNTTITLTFTKNTLPGRERWESQSLALGNATSIIATVTVSAPQQERPATQSITYTKAA